MGHLATKRSLAGRVFRGAVHFFLLFPLTHSAAASMVILALTLPGCATVDGLVGYCQIGWELGTPKQALPARLEVAGRVPVLHLYGSPHEMGTQYGTLLGRALRAESRCIHGFLPTQTVEQYLQFARAHEVDLPPEIREELHAMAEASGVPYDELVALNIVPHVTCSALAVWNPAAPESSATRPAAEPGGLIMGRNADYYSFGFQDRGSILVVRHQVPGSCQHATACISFLGMVGGFTGMNDRGVSFANMLVFNASTRPGDAGDPGKGAITIQLAMRLAAENSANVADMAVALERQPHLIPMLVMVADSRRAEVLELSPEGHRARTSSSGILAASNYFLTDLAEEPYDCPRYAKLIRAAAQAETEHGHPEMTLEEMKDAIYKAAIKKMNMQAVIMEPGPRRLHVSINQMPAAAGPYTTFEMGELLAK